jgi:hypothetical protein
MRRAVAVLLGMLLPILGLADAGLAQPAVQLQGTIQSVDCQNQTVALAAAGGSNVVAATDSTVVLVNSTSVPFCTLQRYVGAAATAWVLPSGSDLQVTRIDVVGPSAEPASTAPAPAVSSSQTLGIVLGALAVGALGYIIGRSTSVQPQPVYAPYQPVYQDGHGRWVGQGGAYTRQCGSRAGAQFCRSEPSINK